MGRITQGWLHFTSLGPFLTWSAIAAWTWIHIRDQHNRGCQGTDLVSNIVENRDLWHILRTRYLIIPGSDDTPISRMCAIENTGLSIFLCLLCWSPVVRDVSYNVSGTGQRRHSPRVPRRPGPNAKRLLLHSYKADSSGRVLAFTYAIKTWVSS